MAVIAARIGLRLWHGDGEPRPGFDDLGDQLCDVEPGVSAHRVSGEGGHLAAGIGVAAT
jgi:hypothetical protein